MQCVGIDLSLTSTGIAVSRHGWLETTLVTSKPPKGGGLYSGKLARFQQIRSDIMMNIATGSESHVYLEGPAYASAGQATHDMAGNWWMLYEMLTDWGHMVTVVPPAVVKQYATGKGNAAKDAVLAAAIKRYPEIDIPGNDIADAVVLMAIGRRLMGQPLEADLPKTHLRAVDKLVKP